MLKDLTREQQLIILGLIFVVVAGLAVMAYRRFAPSSGSEILMQEPDPLKHSQVNDAGKIIVHVTGAVKKEGVFRLKFGDRVIDALKLAGGAAPSADLSSINLAEKVKDGQKIVVPEKFKSVVPERGFGDQGIGGLGTSSSPGKVNINAADEKGLCKIEGIGPSTASRIVEHRAANGPFSRVEDIMRVKGIGKGKFEKIKGQITI